MRIDETTNGFLIFGERKIEFLLSKEKYRIQSFLLTDDKLTEVKQVLKIIDDITIVNSSGIEKKVDRCRIINIYEEMSIPDLIEIKFETNIPIEEVRDLKIKDILP